MMIRVLLASVGLTILNSSPMVAQPTPADPAAVATKNKARFEAAQEAYRLLVEEKKSGAFDPESLYIWSKRLLEAQREYPGNKEQEVAAFKDHLDRMAALEKQAKDWASSPATKDYVKPAQLAATAFYRAEAELWVERTKVKK